MAAASDAAAPLDAGALDEPPMEAPTGDEPKQPVPAPDAAPMPGPVADPTDALLGDYVMRSSFRTVRPDLPFLGDVRVITTSYAVSSVRRDGEGALTLTEQPCRVEAESDSDGLVISVPDMIARSTPPLTSTMDAWVEGGVLRWSRPMAASAVGWTPNAPDEPLPQDASDARVKDADGDGNPGVTVRVRAAGIVNGDVYVVQWQRAQYEGEVDEAGPLRGEVFDESEQRTIGASNLLLNTDMDVEPDPDRSDNRIEMLPVEAPLSCAQLLARLTDYF